ncbi:ribonucleotide-diphosphate reductase subunit alpha [Candidatus Woesearchaeota archaeon]|nr:vitamin B12-dependent ribonucleotide reductase [Candidatus Woesearchaeota archaeon]RLE42462.1 MAG: ribonucleotide-diphosphate reductase subunit alpha [Candidatus Woesearchaeota archaeon]
MKIKIPSNLKFKNIDNKISENGLKVLESRYLMRDGRGRIIETPTQLFTRVAVDIALASKEYGEDWEKDAQEFYNMLTSFEFIPNSPTLMNAGTEMGQLSACFVLPIEDDMASIFEAVKNTALVHKSGGGTGFSFSRLRPAGDIVKTTGGIASGPVSFMRVFDQATETIKQGGKRRGANMGVLSVHHPDIMEFITCKRVEGEFSNFNISVGLTKEFMEALRKDHEYELINPRSRKVVKKLKASEVFNKIVKMAWLNGEPGVLFMDKINEANPTPELGEIEATNPCGEQPLLPFESCNLGHINLTKVLKGEDGRAVIDFEKLDQIVAKAVKFLDNVIDRNRYPIPEIEQMTKGNRKIGLGITGFHEMLIKMGVSYNSKAAIKIAERVMRFIQQRGKHYSTQLAKSRGNFPNWEKSIFAGKTPMRNATVTTIAPTGTTSIIANTSQGIEPLFSVAYHRNVKQSLGKHLFEVNSLFLEMAKRHGFYSKELMEKIAQKPSIQDIDEIPKRVRELFVTAHDIPPEQHIRIQAAFQKYTDNAVSKTVNFPNNATKEDIRKVYLLAYELGCKGVTVYRDGSRKFQILSTKKLEYGKPELPLVPKKRPLITRGATIEMRTGCDSLYVTINEDEEGKPFETFAQMGKSGGCIASFTEAIGRLISLALRSGIEPRFIIKQLRGIRCPRPIVAVGGTVTSCADAIGKALEMFIKGEANAKQTKIHTFSGKGSEESEKKSPQETIIKNGLAPECPECGAMLSIVEGCIVCRNCGYSQCG